MDEKGVGALVVIDEDALAGIISERDYARKVILKGRQSKETKVKEIMTRQVYHTFPEQDVEACLAVMTKHHIRHLPVISDNTVIGMIDVIVVCSILLTIFTSYSIAINSDTILYAKYRFHKPFAWT